MNRKSQNSKVWCRNLPQIDLSGKRCIIIINQLILLRTPGQKLWKPSLGREGFCCSFHVALLVSPGGWKTWPHAGFPNLLLLTSSWGLLKRLAFGGTKELGSTPKRRAAFGGQCMITLNSGYLNIWPGKSQLCKIPSCFLFKTKCHSL